MRIIVGPTMAKNKLSLFCNERLSIETECICFVSLPKNREWRTGIIFLISILMIILCLFCLGTTLISQYEGMNQKLLPQKIRLFSKLAPSLVFRNVKLQYRYLIYPKHVFYNYCNMIFIIFAFTNICTLEKYLYLLLYFHPVFIPVFATLFYILQKALAFPRKNIHSAPGIVTLVVPIFLFC
jgi:hypothetical protein